MKKFQFSLQKILKLREFEENKAEIELARAISQAEIVKQELRGIVQARLQARQESLRNFSMQTFARADQYIERLNYREQELKITLDNANKVIFEKQLIMQEAMKNRKIITTLKEKKRAIYRKEFLQQEDIIFDDIAGILFERKKSTSGIN